MPHQNTPIIEIFSGTMWEAEMIKTLFEAAEITCFLKNTTLNSYAFEPIHSEGVQLMILDSDTREAQKIIDRYLANKKDQ